MKGISNKGIAKIVFALVLLVAIFLSLRKFHNNTCQEIRICMEDSMVSFITQEQVKRIIHTDYKVIEGYKMDEVNIHSIREVLKSNPYIRDASIFKSVSGVLNVDVRQRRPILMVIGNKQSYYIDEDAKIFKASDDYHAKTIVVTGSISEQFNFDEHSVYDIDLNDDSSLMTSLFKLGRLIMADDFWRDQIEQIYVTTLGEFELVPMVGNHILAIGSIDDYDHKMYILKQFYFKALSKIGWNVYNLISVKYRGQIVCRRNKEKVSK